jgi:hypothetical protein
MKTCVGGGGGGPGAGVGWWPCRYHGCQCPEWLVEFVLQCSSHMPLWRLPICSVRYNMSISISTEKRHIRLTIRIGISKRKSQSIQTSDQHTDVWEMVP